MGLQTIGLRQIGIRKPKQGLGSSSSYWNPQNIETKLIAGGVRISFLPCSGKETEIWASINAEAYVLVGTVGIGITYYDHIIELNTVSSLDYKLRTKLDQTILNTPTNLSSTPIVSGGVKLTWNDNNTEAEYIEIYANIESGGYAILTTVNAGDEEYNHLIDSGHVLYKIRAKEGTLPVYSLFTDEIDVTIVSIVPAAMEDGNTAAWYRFDDLSTITKDSNNYVSLWKDKLGSGNDLTQANDGSKPLYNTTGLLFDGSNDSMKKVFTLNQPIFIYAVLRQKSWTIGDRIWDGASSDYGSLYQSASSPGMKVYAGGGSNQKNLTLDTFGIIRVLLNGASSKLQINESAADNGDYGTRNMGGFTLGATGAISQWSNIEVKEIIIRKVADNPTNESAFLNYLKTKYSL